MPRLEQGGEQQSMQRNRGLHGCYFSWGQWGTCVRVSSLSSCAGSCFSSTPCQGSLHLCGSLGIQQLPSHTQKPRWVVCPCFSEAFHRYLHTAGELLLSAEISLSSLRDLLLPVLGCAFCVFNVKYKTAFEKLSPNPCYRKDDVLIVQGLF